ncbi:hypothetical protein H4R18_001645 [Coemansia javaensis]|uniref:Uncharacterized protein n=1 Tax=Coemansia javaensis TaxID=2761396 RepID=A0A9W8HD35_9FUNG|nr:hypothetical protein H4R18_001645 [Coemansia javaensis]
MRISYFLAAAAAFVAAGAAKPACQTCSILPSQLDSLKWLLEFGKYDIGVKGAMQFSAHLWKLYHAELNNGRGYKPETIQKVIKAYSGGDTPNTATVMAIRDLLHHQNKCIDRVLEEYDGGECDIPNNTFVTNVKFDVNYNKSPIARRRV